MKQGIYCPLVTPFSDDGSVNFAVFEELVDNATETGLAGLFVGASTGESWALDKQEKKTLFEVALAKVGGKKAVIAGTGAPSTREAIELSEIAQNAGIEYLCICPPSFVRPDQAEIKQYYTDIARSTDSKILLYNVPVLVGNSIDPPTALDLIDSEKNIIGIKDSTGDLTLLNKLIGRLDQEYYVFPGIDTMILPGLLAGSSGAIVASANIVPEILVDLFRSYSNEAHEEAWKYQNKLTEIWIKLGVGSFPASIKAAVEGLGTNVGSPRAPVSRLSKADLKKLYVELSEVTGKKFGDV